MCASAFLTARTPEWALGGSEARFEVAEMLIVGSWVEVVSERMFVAP